MKRAGDKTPDPPGGRAAARLKMFEEARALPETPVISAPERKTAARPQSPGTRRKKRG
jgi:hypothetical protein